MSFLLGEFCKTKQTVTAKVLTKTGGYYDDIVAGTRVIIIEFFDENPHTIKVIDSDNRKFLLHESNLESMALSIKPKKKLYTTVW